jgi:hypothetical protein
MILHNYCRSRNMDFPIDKDAADMIKKEQEMKVIR